MLISKKCSISRSDIFFALLHDKEYENFLNLRNTFASLWHNNLSRHLEDSTLFHLAIRIKPGLSFGMTSWGDYDYVIMPAMTSQITSLAIADQRKHQSSASLAFVWGIHRGPVISPHKWSITRKMLPFDDVIIGIPDIAQCFTDPSHLFTTVSKTFVMV